MIVQREAGSFCEVAKNYIPFPPGKPLLLHNFKGDRSDI